MDNRKDLLNSKFKALPDGFLNKNKVICTYCRCGLSYHQSMFSLKYHLLDKHTVESTCPIQKQTMQDSFQQRSLDNSTCHKLLTAIAQWVATACRPINGIQITFTRVKLDTTLCQYYYRMIHSGHYANLLLVGLSLPCYSFCIFFEHAVPLTLF